MSAPRSGRLSDRERRALLTIAERSIARALATDDASLLDERTIDEPALRAPGAAFVTLLRGDDLLGCVGTLHAVESLARAVHRAALQAAFADPRLPAVTVADFAVMTIKVSVLSELETVDVASYDELVQIARPGVDGFVIDAPGHRATLLPSVWQQCADAATFFAALWSKAELAPGRWPRGITVQRYTTEEFASYGDADHPRALVVANLTRE